MFAQPSNNSPIVRDQQVAATAVNNKQETTATTASGNDVQIVKPRSFFGNMAHYFVLGLKFCGKALKNFVIIITKPITIPLKWLFGIGKNTDTQTIETKQTQKDAIATQNQETNTEDKNSIDTQKLFFEKSQEVSKLKKEIESAKNSTDEKQTEETKKQLQDRLNKTEKELTELRAEALSSLREEFELNIKTLNSQLGKTKDQKDIENIKQQIEALGKNAKLAEELDTTLKSHTSSSSQKYTGGHQEGATNSTQESDNSVKQKLNITLLSIDQFIFENQVKTTDIEAQAANNKVEELNKNIKDKQANIEKLAADDNKAKETAESELSKMQEELNKAKTDLDAATKIKEQKAQCLNTANSELQKLKNREVILENSKTLAGIGEKVNESSKGLADLIEKIKKETDKETIKQLNEKLEAEKLTINKLSEEIIKVTKEINKIDDLPEMVKPVKEKLLELKNSIKKANTEISNLNSTPVDDTDVLVDQNLDGSKVKSDEDQGFQKKETQINDGVNGNTTVAEDGQKEGQLVE